MPESQANSLLLPAFRFEIMLRRASQIESGSNVTASPNASTTGDLLCEGGFQECTGLEVEMDVQEHLEGGRNDGVIRRVGRAKYSNIVLKRGMFHSKDNQLARELWDWFQGVVSGRRPVARYDGAVAVKNRKGDIVATWIFDRGLPAKIRGPELNAKTGEIAIEELHIAHEGLRLGSD
jgi:phage tail-like protein